ncbi:T9SS type A sorting domain-containing protein [Salibacteraceae bacterium]|nr:T9SS type A sorting domain-containing protein [Salibacteraceae bacterium]
MKNLLLASAVLFSFSAFSQPVITSNPQNVTNCVDSCVMLRVAANGMNLTYQWQQDNGNGFQDVSFALGTDDTLTVCDTGQAAPSSDDYRCIVTDGNGNTIASNSATVSLDSCLAPIADFTFTFDQANVCFTNTSINATTVLWNFGDGSSNSSNSNTPCNDYGTPWYFDVTIYAYNDFGSDSKTMNIDLVGLEELSAAFDVFPNPMNDILNVTSDERVLSIEIMDVNGRILMSQSNPPRTNQLNVSNLASGVYTMVIKSDDGAMFHKLVKQ